MTTVNPISAATSATQSSVKVEAPTPQSNDYQMFLKLLTAQIKNQDPLSPMDATQFVQQTATFSQVEQLVKSNVALDALKSSLGSTLSRLDIGYIGKTVEASVDRFAFDGTNMRMAYAASGAQTVTITITDQDGVPVRTINGIPGSGRQELVWDGTRNDGSKAGAGDYSIKIAATDKDGKDIDALVVVNQRVKEVVPGIGGNPSTLILEGGGKINPDDIISVTAEAPGGSA